MLRPPLALLLAFLAWYGLADDRDVLAVVGTPSASNEVRSSPIPVSIITRDDILSSGFTNAGEALASLVPGLAFPRPSIAGGTDHAQPFSYRGFAPDQVAVTLNGKAWHKSSVFHRDQSVGHGSVGVDLTMIPVAAIERIEILADGASDQYGSGAIGGVVNIVLDESRRGAFVTATYSRFRTSVDGVPAYRGLVPDGDDFELFELVGRPDPIDDGDGDTAFVAGSWGTDVFDEGFLRLSADYRRSDATQRSGRDPRPQYPPLPDGGFDPREVFFERRSHRLGNVELRDFSMLANLRLPLGERFALGGYAGTSVRSARSGDLYRRSVEERNVVALYPDGYLPIISSDIDDRYSQLELRYAGVNWDWSFSLTNGEDEIDWTVRQSLNASYGEISPTRFSAGNNESRIRIINFSARREWPGVRPVALALAAEQSSTEYENEIGDFGSFSNGGALTPAGAPAEIGVQGFVGARPVDDFDFGDDSNAVFASAAVELTPRLNTVAGLRFTDHSEAGGVWSGRLAARFEATTWLAVRGTLGRHFRAPSLAQSHFTESRLVDDGTTLTEMGIYGVDTAPATALGAAPLEHEISNNVVLGVQLYALEGWTLSLDAYAVDIADRVVLSDELSGAALDGVPGTDTEGVESVRFSTNALDSRTVGFDLLTGYRLATRVGRFDLNLGLNVNDVAVSDVGDAGLTGRQAVGRIERGTPDSKLHLGARWTRERFFWVVNARRYGEVVDVGERMADDLVIGPEWLLDTSFGYAFNGFLSMTFGINNVLDRYPDSRPRDSIEHRIVPFSNFSPFGFNGREVWLRFDGKFD